MDTTNVLVLLAARALGAPVIIAERTDPLLHDIGPIWEMLRRWTYPSADALVCQTDSALARFQARIKVNGCVIPNPVISPYGLGERTKQTKDHVVAAMGRLEHPKGFDMLLQAFSQIACGHPDWRLVIMGEGPLRTQLQQQAISLNLRDRVKFPGELSDPFS